MSISVCYIWWQWWDPLPASQCAAEGGVSTRLEEVRLKARAWSEWEQAIKQVTGWVTTVMRAQRASDKGKRAQGPQGCRQYQKCVISKRVKVATSKGRCEKARTAEQARIAACEDRWGGMFCFYYDVITYSQMCIQERGCINDTNYPYSIITPPTCSLIYQQKGGGVFWVSTVIT